MEKKFTPEQVTEYHRLDKIVSEGFQRIIRLPKDEFDDAIKLVVEKLGADDPMVRLVRERRAELILESN